MFKSSDIMIDADRGTALNRARSCVALSQAYPSHCPPSSYPAPPGYLTPKPPPYLNGIFGAPTQASRQANEISNASLSVPRTKTTTFLNLTKDVLEAFGEVPYVKTIAAIALQIIKIAEDVKTNKERCNELVDKALGFTRIVFEALLSFKNSQRLCDLSGIREDLLEIRSVFESVSSTLAYLRDWGSVGPWGVVGASLKKGMSRHEIGQKIDEQDRRLDTAITMFQFKAMIKLREGVNVRPDEHKIPASYIRNVTPGLAKRTFAWRTAPQIFFGRGKELAAISELITHGIQQGLPARICILGPGGIGKTSLALTLFHRDPACTQFEGERYFISCETTPSAELLLGELASSFAISAEGDVHQTLLLRLQKTPCVIVLDNFETPWDMMDSRSEVESLLSSITSINTVTLIITMRGSQRPSGTRWSEILPPLTPIDVNDAMAIFQAIARKSDHHSRCLIEAVDCVPLAVTLLANLAAVDGETTEGLWLRWKKENTAMVELGGDKLSNLERSIELSISSPRMQHNHDALVFLSVLSLLPDGMSSDTLAACETAFPGGLMAYKAVSTLRQNALIYEDANKRLRILNPIRLFMLKHHQPSRSHRTFLYNHFIQLARQGNLYANPAIRSRLYQEFANVIAVLFDALELATTAEIPEIVRATVHFHQYIYLVGKRTTQVIYRAIERLETSKAPSYLTYNSTSILSVTGDKVTVGQALRDRLRKSLLRLNFRGKIKLEDDQLAVDPEAASMLRLYGDCLGICGQILTQQFQYPLALAKLKMAKELHTRAGDIGGRAYDTLNMGLVLSRDEGQYKHAMALFEEAISLHQKCGDTYGKAYCLLATGMTLRDNCQFSQAETMLTSAVSLFSDLNDSYGQIRAWNGLGMVLVHRSRAFEAERIFRDAINLSVNAGDTFGQAYSMSGLAHILALSCRFPEAQSAIEESIRLREPYANPNYLHILGRIYAGKEEWNQAEDALSHACDIHQEIGDRRGAASDLYYLASIKYNLGEMQSVQELGNRTPLKNGTNTQVAQIKSLFALILLDGFQYDEAERELAWALNVHRENEDDLEQGHTLYAYAIYHFYRGELEEALGCLEQALELHQLVGYPKGQADAYNIMAEIYTKQSLIPKAEFFIGKALSIHRSIGNRSGEANDLLIQAGIFLAQCRYRDAWDNGSGALKLHEASKSKRGKARDLALLSKISWRLQGQAATDLDGIESFGIEDNTSRDSSLKLLEQAIQLFKELGALHEMNGCIIQKQRMTEIIF